MTLKHEGRKKLATAVLTEAKIEQFSLKKKFMEWGRRRKLAPRSANHLRARAFCFGKPGPRCAFAFSLRPRLGFSFGDFPMI